MRMNISTVKTEREGQRMDDECMRRRMVPKKDRAIYETLESRKRKDRQTDRVTAIM